MIITESFLLEATFLNPNNLRKHYLDHVLQPGEIFDPNNPKFPYMSEEEYAKRAEELSLVDTATTPGYTGFITGRQGKTRCEKFKVRSTIYKDKNIASIIQANRIYGTFCDLVIYVDDEVHGTEIITYMVGRPGKIHRESAYKIADLPPVKTESMTVSKAIKTLRNESDS